MRRSPGLFAAEPARHAALRLGCGVLDLLVEHIDRLVHLRPRFVDLLGCVGCRLVVLRLRLVDDGVDLGTGLGAVLFGIRVDLAGGAAGAVADGLEVAYTMLVGWKEKGQDIGGNGGEGGRTLKVLLSNPRAATGAVEVVANATGSGDAEDEGCARARHFR